MWGEHALGLFKRVRFLDGTESHKGERVMRRLINGEWQYRPLTEEEEMQSLADRW